MMLANPTKKIQNCSICGPNSSSLSWSRQVYVQASTYVFRREPGSAPPTGPPVPVRGCSDGYGRGRWRWRACARIAPHKQHSKSRTLRGYPAVFWPVPVATTAAPLHPCHATGPSRGQHSGTADPRTAA